VTVFYSVMLNFQKNSIKIIQTEANTRQGKNLCSRLL